MSTSRNVSIRDKVASPSFVAFQQLLTLFNAAILKFKVKPCFMEGYQT